MANHLSGKTIQALRDYADPIINELEYLKGQCEDLSSQLTQARAEHKQALVVKDALKMAELEQKIARLDTATTIAYENYRERRKELGRTSTASEYQRLLKDFVWPNIRELEHEDWLKVEALSKELITLRESIQKRRSEINAEVLAERKKLQQVLDTDSYFSSYCGLSTSPCGNVYIGSDDGAVTTPLD